MMPSLAIRILMVEYYNPNTTGSVSLLVGYENPIFTIVTFADDAAIIAIGKTNERKRIYS